VDAGALANILRRPALPAETGAFERLSLSVKLAITVASAQGGRLELARELQTLAGRYPVIRLVQSPGGSARLEAGSFRFQIPATLRDALLAAARAPGTEQSPASATAASVLNSPAAAAALLREALPAASLTSAVSAARPLVPTAQTAAMPGSSGEAAAATSAATAASVSSAARAAAPAEVAALASASLRAAEQWPALMAAQSAAPKPRATRDDVTPTRLELPLADPLLDETLDTAQAAARLTGALRASSLFTEAQLARTIARGADEGQTQAAVPRESLRPLVELPLAERTAAQLDVLKRDAASFVLGAWSGQSARLDIGREPIDAEAGSGATERAQVFFATLQLELPQLGAVLVRLRLLNATLAATVETSDPTPWQAALPELAAQLHARGLQPAALSACPSAAEDRDACTA
jgi:hypothetical protein